jgi:hypothetical protein
LRKNSDRNFRAGLDSLFHPGLNRGKLKSEQDQENIDIIPGTQNARLNSQNEV